MRCNVRTSAPQEVDDVIAGCGLPEGRDRQQYARTAALRAGCPVSVPGQTLSRFCASGLDAIAAAAARVATGSARIVVASGVESVSLVQPNVDLTHYTEEWLLRHAPDVYMPMLFTGRRRRETLRDFEGAPGRIRAGKPATHGARAERGTLRREIVPLESWQLLRDDRGVREERSSLQCDEGNRPETTAEALSALRGAVPGVADTTITAGNSSQLSDGAASVVLMDEGLARERGLTPLGALRDYAVAGCAPDEMGIGPALAVPKLLQRNGLRSGDIDVWELNEAFAVQTLYCRDALDIDPERLNVDGAARLRSAIRTA